MESSDDHPLHNRGWASFMLGQVLLTSIALGALKRNGAIVFHGDKIQNEAARTIISKAVSAAVLHVT
jgi:hypothetical protein